MTIVFFIALTFVVAANACTSHPPPPPPPPPNAPPAPPVPPPVVKVVRQQEQVTTLNVCHKECNGQTVSISATGDIIPSTVLGGTCGEPPGELFVRRVFFSRVGSSFFFFFSFFFRACFVLAFFVSVALAECFRVAPFDVSHSIAYESRFSIDPARYRTSCASRNFFYVDFLFFLGFFSFACSCCITPRLCVPTTALMASYSLRCFLRVLRFVAVSKSLMNFFIKRKRKKKNEILSKIFCRRRLRVFFLFSFLFSFLSLFVLISCVVMLFVYLCSLFRVFKFVFYCFFFWFFFAPLTDFVIFLIFFFSLCCVLCVFVFSL